MKTYWKRFALMILVLTACIMLGTAQKASAVTLSDVKTKMDAYTAWLKTKGYTTNKTDSSGHYCATIFWNADLSTSALKTALNSGNFDTGTTTTKCPRTDDSHSYSSTCHSNYFSGGRQCNGFVRYFWYYLYGTDLEWDNNQTYSKKYTSYAAAGGVQRGDVIGFSGHYGVVDYVDSKGNIIFFHANGWGTRYPCGIAHSYWWTSQSSTNFLNTQLLSSTSTSFFIRRHKDLIGSSGGGDSGTQTDCEIYGCSASNGSGTYICTASGGLAINSGHNYSSQIGTIPYGATVTVSKVASSATYAHVTYNGVSGISSINYLKPYSATDECTTYNCVTDYAGYYKVSGTAGALVLHNAHNYNDSSAIGQISEGTIVWVTKGSTTKTYRHVTYGSQEGIMSGNYLKKMTSYTLSLNGNGGTVPKSSFTVWMEVGDFSDLSGYLPTRSGYSFLGWYTAASGGTQVYNAYGKCTNEGTYWKSGVWNYSGNVTLYAHWQMDTVYVSSISIPATLTLVAGNTQTLTATVTPSNATNKTVEWSSSDTSVVTVSEGVVTAVSAGTAFVTASAVDGAGASASCAVTVNPSITDIALNRYLVNLAAEGIGSSFPLRYAITPADGVGSISWSSSDPGVAVVSGDGVVTAVGDGRATVTATVQNGPSVSCIVKVDAGMPLMTLPDDLMIIEDQAFRGVAAQRIALPSGVETIGAQAFANSSALRFVLIPNSVTSIAADAFQGDGSLCLLCGHDSVAEQFAIDNGIEYMTDESAAFVYVRSVTLPSAFSIALDETAYLDATVLPENASNPALAWSTSDAGVVSVAEDGALSALAPGTATVTAVALDGSGRSDSCAVTVTLPQVTVSEVLDATNTVIDCTDATIVATLSIGGVPVSRVQKVGIRVYGADGGSLGSHMDDPTLINGALVTSYDMNALGIELEASTTYQYRYVVLVSGLSYYSDYYSFSTIAGYPRIRFDSDELTVSVGSQTTLSPRVEFTDATDIVWRSSNTSVAYVIDDVLYASGAGTATITAMLAEDPTVTAVCQVTVVNGTVAYSLQLSPTEAQLSPGETQLLAASISPSAGVPIQWSSSAPEIAMVENGAVTALKPGRAVIIAEVSELGLSASCAVEVSAVPVRGIILSASELTLTVGGEASLTAQVLPENAGNPALVWTSGDSAVAGVDEGRVLAYAPGTVAITAAATDGSGVSAQCLVTVTAGGGGEETLSCGCSTEYAGDYVVTGTDGSLAINDGHGWGAGYTQLGEIPEGATVHVSAASGPSGVSGNWGHVTYGGVSGYSAMRYLTPAGEYVDTSAENVNPEKLARLIQRANAWADYTWTAATEIPVYNNEYTESGSEYNGVEYWYPAGTAMRGIPYTLASSKYNLSTYPGLTDAKKQAATTFVYSGVTMWGPRYGGDCSCLANDVLWYADSAIGHDGQTNVSTAKAHLYAHPDWDDVAPGDILAVSGHVVVVIAVNGNSLTIVESRGNGSDHGALHCPNKTARAAGGYYVCGTCEYCSGSKKCGAIRRTVARSVFQNAGYSVYRYKQLYT